MFRLTQAPLKAADSYIEALRVQTELLNDDPENKYLEQQLTRTNLEIMATSIFYPETADVIAEAPVEIDLHKISDTPSVAEIGYRLAGSSTRSDYLNLKLRVDALLGADTLGLRRKALLSSIMVLKHRELFEQDPVEAASLSA